MTSGLLKHKYTEYILLALGLSILFMFVIAQTEKLSPLFLIALGIAPILLYTATLIRGAFSLFFILLSITLFENEPGIQPIEWPFYILIIILTLYILLEFIRGSLATKTTLDKLFLLFLLLLPYGLILGVLNGAQLYMSFGEIASFSGLLIYFPLRKELRYERFRKVLGWVVLLIVFYVVIRNLVNYRSLLLQTVVGWQAEKARVASNEIILVFGSLLFMSAAAITKSNWKQIAFTGIFLAFLGSLILTQSRGYWLSFFFGVVVIFTVVNKRGKIRIFFTLIVLSFFSILIAHLFFGDFLSLVLKGLAARFNTLGSGTIDLSLQERILESKTVLDMMIHNPIAGYGIGYAYTKKILFYDYFISTSYVHNGYLAMWMKFGIVGLVTIISIWILCIYKAISLYRKNINAKTNTIALSIAGTVTGMILVNNTSPQVLTFESLLLITIFGAYLSHKLSIKEGNEDKG